MVASLDHINNKLQFKAIFIYAMELNYDSNINEKLT